MKNETKLVKVSRVYLKVFYVVWVVLLVALLGLSLATDNSAKVLPVLALVLFGGAAIYRMWKNAVVEIVIDGEVVHFEFFSNKVEHIKAEAIIHIRATSMGPVLTMSDGTEFHSMGGPLHAVVRNGEHVTKEFRKEDFPHAKIVGKK